MAMKRNKRTLTRRNPIVVAMNARHPSSPPHRPKVLKDDDRPALDYEPCGDCGFDHAYEQAEAAEAHRAMDN